MSLGKKIKNKNSLTRRILSCQTETMLPKQREAPLCPAFKGSLTVEAAVSIPVFVCFMAVILYFFCLLQLELQVERALHIAAEEVAEYACLESSHPTIASPVTELAMAKGLLVKSLEEQSAQTERIMGGAAGVSIISSDFTGDFVTLRASYQIKMPIRLFGISGFRVSQTAKARKWTGGNITENKKEWVYVTPTGSVYHRSKSCPYLDLSIHSVQKSEVAQYRNKSGGRYQKCGRCQDEENSVVYITDYGDNYHGSITCSGLKRTVYQILIEEARERKACSKCGG